MESSFNGFFEWLMGWEGEVYENDPDDPGGATKYGIDQRSHPDVNIRELTRAKAKVLYVLNYWLPVRGPELPSKLDQVVMDIAVNNGRTRAVQWLQKAAGAKVDGVFGPKTMKAVKEKDAFVLAISLLKRREQFYRAIATGRKKKFLKGWLNRNNSLIRRIS